jgi:alcohol dehydrogenase class IV
MSSLLNPILLMRPTTVDFGPGRAAAIGGWAEEKEYRRILVVSDAYNSTRIDRLGLRVEPVVFGTVKPEPDLANLDALLALAEETQPDLVIGYGGGSAMDIAKLAAVLPGSGQTIRDVVGSNKVAKRKIGLVQVPTTAGTGSEAGMRALVTDPQARSKLAVESREMLADLAVVDPDLTVTVPPAITAATGIDALAHCVEAYTSKRSHPVIDIYAIGGIRLVGQYIGRAVRDGADREARAGMALASLYGGFCLGPVNTTAGHAVSYPLGTRHNIAHGLANALIFPHVLAFNAPVVEAKTRDVLQALGTSQTIDDASIRTEVTAFCAALGIDMAMSAHGVPAGDLPTMADDAATIRRLLDFNPRDISRDDILGIYERSY